MAFEGHVRQLADAASLKIAEVDEKHAVFRFNSDSGTQTLWVLPFDDVWEFSCQSAINFPNIEDFPQKIAVLMLAMNAKNKRAFWCIEKIGDKHVLSAMLNFPQTALTAAEFERICIAIVREVERLEKALLDSM